MMTFLSLKLLHLPLLFKPAGGGARRYTIFSLPLLAYWEIVRRQLMNWVLDIMLDMIVKTNYLTWPKYQSIKRCQKCSKIRPRLQSCSHKRYDHIKSMFLMLKNTFSRSKTCPKKCSFSNKFADSIFLLNDQKIERFSNFQVLRYISCCIRLGTVGLREL